MLKDKIKLAILTLAIIFIANFNPLLAQSLEERHVGDVITFSDGLKGVVCYVNPTDATKGWAVALYDLKDTFALWSGINHPTGIPHVSKYDFMYYLKSQSENGKENTRILLENGSPAADAVGFYDGWYIPDAFQLLTIVHLTPILKEVMESVDGDVASILTRRQAVRHIE